jgi:hypothetical protein
MAVADPDVTQPETAGGDRQHQRRELLIRVYVYPHDGRWFAETTDLSLMTEGADEHEALQCLFEQIAAYIKTSVSLGLGDDVLRPAPLRHRIALQLRVAWAKLRRQPAFVRIRPVHI